MLNIMDFLTGRVLETKPGPVSRRPPCTPDIPRDPEPVRPPEPFWTTGPDVGKLAKSLKKRSKSKQK